MSQLKFHKFFYVPIFKLLFSSKLDHLPLWYTNLSAKIWIKFLSNKVSVLDVSTPVKTCKVCKCMSELSKDSKQMTCRLIELMGMLFNVLNLPSLLDLMTLFAGCLFNEDIPIDLLMADNGQQLLQQDIQLLDSFVNRMPEPLHFYYHVHINHCNYNVRVSPFIISMRMEIFRVLNLNMVIDHLDEKNAKKFIKCLCLVTNGWRTCNGNCCNGKVTDASYFRKYNVVNSSDSYKCLQKKRLCYCYNIVCSENLSFLPLVKQLKHISCI